MYAKIENEATKLCSVGIGTDTAFYESIGMTEMDVEEAYDGKWYIKGYAPAPPLNEVKAYKIQELKNYRNTEEESPILYKGKLWDFDSKSRDRINAAATALEVNNIESIEWTANDDTSMLLTANDLKSIVSNAALRGDALHTKYRTLRDTTNAATSIEEINAVQW